MSENVARLNQFKNKGKDVSVGFIQLLSSKDVN